ncbi:MAG TPA: hypothetical protein VLI93_04900 [Acetobacteraceae bacterium]|nr:hypothetical protein [Acetobacteraceae bacterium]
MSNVSIPEIFPKSTFSRADVEAEQKLRLSVPGCVSSTITESGNNSVLTTVLAPADTVAEPPAAVAAAPPPQSALDSGLRAAVRMNEIGDASPYKLSFAGKGKSGASFGFMQGDMAAGQPIVHAAFRAALEAADVPPETITSLAQRLSVPLIFNPLDPENTALVNNALDAPAGREQVDAMDRTIFDQVCTSLDKCVEVAQASGRQIMPKAQIYMLLWINMTGPPTTLLSWLAGNPVTLAKLVPRPGPTIDGDAMHAYLAATSFYTENPQDLPHILLSAAAGMNAIAMA